MSIYDIIAGGGNQLGSGMQTGLNMGLQLREAKQSEDAFALESMLKKKEDARAEEESSRKKSEAEHKEKGREAAKKYSKKYGNKFDQIADALYADGFTEAAEATLGLAEKTSKLKKEQKEKAYLDAQRHIETVGRAAVGQLKAIESGRDPKEAAQEYIQTLWGNDPQKAAAMTKQFAAMTPEQIVQRFQQRVGEAESVTNALNRMSREEIAEAKAAKAKAAKLKTPTLQEKKMAEDRLATFTEGTEYADLKDDLGKTGMRDLSAKLASAAKKEISEDVTFDEAMDQIIGDFLKEKVYQEGRSFTDWTKTWKFKKEDQESEYSQEDLEFTAKKYGISVEEVKKRLNK